MDAYTPYISTAIISVVPNVILFLIPDWFLHSLNGTRYMLCFAAGALLGDVFLHSLPHLLMHDHNHHHESGEEEGDEHMRGMIIGCIVVGGFVIFMLVCTVILEVKSIFRDT